MHERLKRLDNYLRVVGQQAATRLMTEDYDISVENLHAKGEFLETDMFIPFREGDELTALDADCSQYDFVMLNEYQLSLNVRNYGADVDALLRVLLHWLHQENQKPVLTGLAEKNNQSTFDLFIDMQISERSQKTGDGIRTC